MTTDTFVMYAKYNSYANDQMFQHIAKLSDAEWKKEFPGYFKSVKALCNHLYIADFNWLKRFGLIRKFKCLDNPLFQKELSANSEAFDSIAEYNSKRRELDKLIAEFVLELRDEDFRGQLNYKNLKGEPQTRNTGGAAMHFFNHDTHHRGMISLYLEFLGQSNDFNSLVSVA
jgi:uncharacterized damage-inducible protein DinB